MYTVGTWFVSGICVWIPRIKETMMIIIIVIVIIIIHPIRNIILEQIIAHHVISGFRLYVNEMCALLAFYAA